MAKSRWIQKPPLGSSINYGHPLSRGLVGCWLLNERNGIKIYDRVDNQSSTLVKSVWSSYGGGGIQINPAEWDSGAVLPLQVAKQNEYTLVTKAVSFSTTNNRGGTILNGDTNSNGAGIFLGSAGASSTNTFIVLKGGVSWNSSGIVFSAYKIYSLAIVVKSTNIIDLYIDGVYKYSTSNTALVTAATKSRFGMDLAASTGALNGVIFFGYFYNRALSPSEIQQLYTEPYCFISRPKRRTYFISSTPPVVSTKGYMTTNRGYWGA